jgi:predicted RNase H-like HicB family nuclease
VRLTTLQNLCTASSDPIIIERGQSSFGGHVPALNGGADAAITLEEVQLLIDEAIVAHVSLLREQDLPIPPVSIV